HPRCPVARVPHHHQHHPVRGERSRPHTRILRRDDGAWSRGNDDLPRLLVRKGARPGTFFATGAIASPVLAHPRGAATKLALQPVTALPAIPDGKARF